MKRGRESDEKKKEERVKARRIRKRKRNCSIFSLVPIALMHTLNKESIPFGLYTTVRLIGKLERGRDMDWSSLSVFLQVRA